MFEKIKIPLLTGLTFSGIAYGVVRLLGFNSNSFMILSYLYIVLALVLTVQNSSSEYGGLKSLLGNIVIVAEEEETKLKRVVTGEKYKIKGELEKVQ